jgi:AcrR family transcriptional regulator
MANPSETRRSIIRAALALFLRQGIKQTSLAEIAFQAGVTRVTLYRYFADKMNLVEEALQSIPEMLEQQRSTMVVESPPDLDRCLGQLAAEFVRLPHGDLPALLDEVRRLYPDLFISFHQRRLTAIGSIFTLLLDRAEDFGLLRPGLNPLVVQAYFMSTVANVMENPGLALQALSAEDIFTTIRSVFLYGILKNPQ